VIASLSGTVTATTQQGAVIEVGGVGYSVHAPTSLIANLKPGKPAKMFTELVVRDDSMTLYGFESLEQQELFRNLIGVSGLGPKGALALLSTFKANELAGVVAAGDVDAITTVPGIGKRGAERIILELKGKLQLEVVSSNGDSKTGQVKDALVALGYTPAEFRDVLSRLNGNDAPVEELVRTALRELAKT
jgi:holliday junction DNA helicase RuvA